MPLDIGQIVNDALAQAQGAVDIGYQDATLTKLVATTRTAGQLTAGLNPTTTTYACKAIPTSRAKKLSGANPSQPISYAPAATNTQHGDSGILIMRASIASGAVPAPNDKITIGASTYSLVTVDLDAARAVYICTARGL